jgi:outer membrane protein TolC
MGDLAVARENLSFLIGQDASAAPLVDNLGVPSLMPEDAALQNAEERSDLRALQEDVEAKKYAIRVARADYWPGVNLVGDYFTRRLGFQKEIDWDVLLNIDVPIFQGGRVAAQTDEALSI